MTEIKNLLADLLEKLSMKKKLYFELSYKKL